MDRIPEGVVESEDVWNTKKRRTTNDTKRGGREGSHRATSLIEEEFMRLMFDVPDV
jgi:hypothetical protein